MFTPTQLAQGKANAIAAGIANPTPYDIEEFALDVAADALGAVTTLTPVAPAIDAVTLAQDIADLVTEAKANATPEVLTFLTQLEGIVLPILTKAVGA